MPRRPRIAVAGVPLHVIQRGNNRQACFFSANDHQPYLEWLAQYAQQRTHDPRLCVDDQPCPPAADAAAADSAGRLMKRLGQRYVQYVNRSYRGSGPLWEGRYRSCIAQDEVYVLACYR